MSKLIIGLVIFAVGLWAAVSWWWFVLDIIKGLVAIFLLLAGLSLIGLGVKDTATTKPQVAEETAPVQETK
jgi:hypothetical protein